MSFVGSKLLGVDVTRTSTAKEHDLGDCVRTNDGKEYVYILADGAITAGGIVTIASGFDCALAGNAGVAWAVAETAIADGSYGWVTTKGYVASADAATSVASGDLLDRLCDGSGDLVAYSAGDPVFAKALADDTAGKAPIYIF